MPLRITYTVFIFTLLCWLKPVSAEIPFVGLSVGPAKSSSTGQFDVNSSLYLFAGLQTEYLLTYEIGISLFKTTTPPDKTTSEDYVLQQLTGSALVHLPMGDSSVFIRLGFSAYQYYDEVGLLRDIFAPTYGAGFDFAIKHRQTIRLEWQRYAGLKFNNAEFEFETVRVGFYIYF